MRSYLYQHQAYPSAVQWGNRIITPLYYYKFDIHQVRRRTDDDSLLQFTCKRLEVICV